MDRLTDSESVDEHLVGHGLDARRTRGGWSTTKLIYMPKEV